jgi:dihydrodipicolinate synthase/N-acetylneuraminate lyase
LFNGSIVAIVTPFKNGAVDEEKLRELVEFQICSGTDAIVPCGTTGESATLDDAEHDRVIEIVIQQVGKRVPVKTALGLMGKCSDEVRLPLCPMSDANKAKLTAIMNEYLLI